MIPTRITTAKKKKQFKHQNSVNLDNLIQLTLDDSDSHINQSRDHYDNRQHLTVRITSRQNEHSTKLFQNTRNPLNLININTTNNTHNNRSARLRLATWNIRSLNRKAAPICELISSRRVDILALNETWLSAGENCNPNLVDVINTLQDYDFINLPRSSGTGGGVGVFLRKAFIVKHNTTHPFKSMEYLDLFITSGSASLRLLTVYRPPPSKANKLTTKIFFDEFSVLIQDHHH